MMISTAFLPLRQRLQLYGEGEGDDVGAAADGGAVRGGTTKGGGGGCVGRKFPTSKSSSSSKFSTSEGEEGEETASSAHNNETSAATTTTGRRTPPSSPASSPSSSPASSKHPRRQQQQQQQHRRPQQQQRRRRRSSFRRPQQRQHRRSEDDVFDDDYSAGPPLGLYEDEDGRRDPSTAPSTTTTTTPSLPSTSTTPSSSSSSSSEPLAVRDDGDGDVGPRDNPDVDVDGSASVLRRGTLSGLFLPSSGTAAEDDEVFVLERTTTTAATAPSSLLLRNSIRWEPQDLHDEFRNLCHLDLSRCFRTTSGNSNNTNVGNTNVGNDADYFFRRVLPSLLVRCRRSLVKLDFADNQLTDRHAVALGRALSRSSYRDGFVRDFNTNDNDRSEASSSSGSRIVGLRQLSLSSNSIGPDGVRGLLLLTSTATSTSAGETAGETNADSVGARAATTTNPFFNLEGLSLADNLLGSDGCRVVADAICGGSGGSGASGASGFGCGTTTTTKSTRRPPPSSSPSLLPRLKVLALAGNGIGDGGAAALAEALRSSTKTKIEELYLQRNRIGRRGCLALARRGLACNDSLVELYLHRNPVRFFTSSRDGGSEDADGDDGCEESDDDTDDPLVAVERALLYRNYALETFSCSVAPDSVEGENFLPIRPAPPAADAASDERGTAAGFDSSIRFPIGDATGNEGEGGGSNSERLQLQQQQRERELLQRRRTKSVQNRIYRLCEANRRVKECYGALVAGRASLPVSAYPLALELIGQKPDLLFRTLKDTPDLFLRGSVPARNCCYDIQVLRKRDNGTKDAAVSASRSASSLDSVDAVSLGVFLVLAITVAVSYYCI